MFSYHSYIYQRAIRLSKNANTPKRLKNIVPIIDKMVWRHLKCPYKLFFDKFCPSKVLWFHFDQQRMSGWLLLFSPYRWRTKWILVLTKTPYWFASLQSRCYLILILSLLQEWMSERSVQIQTQGPPNASTTTLASSEVSIRTGLNDAAPKPRFVDFTCSYVEASLFLQVVLTWLPESQLFLGLPIRRSCDQGHNP